MSITSRCVTCKENKPASDFYHRLNRAKRHASQCKECAKKDKRAIYSFNSMRARWNAMARRSIQKGWAIMSRAAFFSWHEAQVKKCVYCGLSGESSKAMYKSNLAVDRKDSSKGYTADNIALSCLRCNQIKGAHLSFDQMMTVASMFFRPKVVI